MVCKKINKKNNNKRNGMCKLNWKTLLYFVIGIWVVHFLHISRFYLVNWNVISAFPNWEIKIICSFYLSFILFPLSLIAIVLFNLSKKVWIFALCLLITELISQLIGRSLIKLVLDIGIWAIIAGNYFIFHLYDISHNMSGNENTLKIMHSEILGILRTTVSICLFAIGTLGITVVSRLITQYFDNELGQGTAWCYIIGLLYISFGMVYFIIIPLYTSMVKVRKRIK